MLSYIVSNSVITFFLYILPGYALLLLIAPTRSFSLGERIGLSIGLSLPIYSIVVLWCYVLGVSPGKLLAILPGVIALLAILWSNRSRINLNTLQSYFNKSIKWHLHDGAWLIVTLVIGYTRLIPVGNMVAPAWGDSVHHTIIVRLLLEHGGLFQSWLPYAPIETFTYHFGYHILIACWSWITGMNAELAVVTASQILNLLAICTLYPLASKLSKGNQFAGIGAMIIAGLFVQMPAYYVNWGRYTQLTAQIILPVFVWLLDEWLSNRSNPRIAYLLGVTITSIGLALAHYRITVLAVAAVLAWLIWSSWLHRDQWLILLHRLCGLAGSGIAAGLILLPWLLIVRNGRLFWLAGAIGSRSVDSVVNQSELTVWRSLDIYYPYFLWQIAIGFLIIGLYKNRYLSVPMLLWCGFSFLAASPFLIGLGGTGLVTNFLLALGSYLVIAIILGWIWGEINQFLIKLQGGRFVTLSLIVIMLIFGSWVQRKIVDPFYQLVTRSDIQLFAWIQENTPPNARFLVNGFLAYGNSVVVGADAGWWLPYYTKRENTVPPILYTTEKLQPTIAHDYFRQLIINVQDSQGKQIQLRNVLCEAKITHVFLGQKQGKVGFGFEPLVPVTWLQANSDFRLLHQVDQSQVWEFDRSKCQLSKDISKNSLSVDSDFSKTQAIWIGENSVSLPQVALFRKKFNLEIHTKIANCISLRTHAMKYG